MPPISLPYIGGMIRSFNYNVKIYDCVAEQISLAELIHDVIDDNPVLLIVNTSTVTIDNDIRVTEHISKRLSTHISLFGVHVTAMPEYVLRHDFIRDNRMHARIGQIACLAGYSDAARTSRTGTWAWRETRSATLPSIQR